MNADIALIVNCYERTWVHALTPGFFDNIEALNRVSFSEKVLVINNVKDRSVVAQAARLAIERRELHRFVFVSDYIAPALRIARLSPRILRRHPYFLNWGLVLPLATGCEWLLVWDAEVQLEEAHDWLSPSISFMEANRNVFSANPAWPERGAPGGTLAKESVDCHGPFVLNWGFSDQVFLVRRKELLQARFRSFAPAAYCRNKDTPGSFEARVEAFQRSFALARATYANVRYSHNDIGYVMDRVGRSWSDRIRAKLLRLVEKILWRYRSRLRAYPRFRLP
jgi:hypothetical protein